MPRARSRALSARPWILIAPAFAALALAACNDAQAPGAVATGDAATHVPADGAVTSPRDGGVPPSDGAVLPSDGAVVLSDGAMAPPDGAIGFDAASPGDGALPVSDMIVTGGGGSHPRIFLDGTTLATLATRARSGAATWTRLRTVCEGFLAGTVNYPDGVAYPDPPDVNIGSGYQGDGYTDPLYAEGLCYRVGQLVGDADTARFGAKGADILEKMSNPTHSPLFAHDDGYGIRNYGIGMAIGFDWLYDAMSPSLRQQVWTQLDGWIGWFDTSGFGRDHPCGNYFAGYYAAKGYAAIATAGDDPNAPAMWSDWYGRLYNGGANAVGSSTGVQQYYAAHLGGGGWPEGWEYGPGAILHMGLPALAAATGKGVDLIGTPQASGGFPFPLEQGLHLMELAWPTLAQMDDRDALHSLNPPSYPAEINVNLATVTSSLLARYQHPLAAQFHAWTRAVRTAHGAGSPWIDLLFWDETATEQPYTTLPTSFEAPGLSTVAMRSDWSATATWASLRAAAYVDYGGSGEQFFDAGGLAVVRGATPLLVNATGFLVTTYPGTSENWENQIYDEVWGTGHLRRVFNTFYNGTTGQTTVPVDAQPAPTTGVTRFEDAGAYVLTQADGLADVYPMGEVSAWSRSVVYLRPNRFVVFDRTQVPDTSGDQHMNWHLLFTPTQSAPSSTGAVRYDVTNPTAGYVGALTTVLPASAPGTLTDVFGAGKVFRVEVRPTTQATSERWLTVIETATAASQVAAAAPVTTTGGSGVRLSSATPQAVVFADSPTGTLGFTVPAAATTLVIGGLAPSGAYRVGAVATGGNLAVTVAPGSGFNATKAGALYLDLGATGTVVPGT